MAVNRKLALLSLALVLLVPLLFAASDANPVQAQAPAGHWTFDDGSGSQAVDSSGNGRTATLVNGISWIPGEIGGAVSADAANHQYVSIAPIDLSGTHAVTVSLWTNRNYSTTGGHALFEATADYTNSTSGFGLFPDDATCHGIQAALRGDIGLTANCYSPPSSGVWHHLAVVFDKSQTGGNQVLFYVDGVLQSAIWSVYASTNTNNFGNDPLYLFSRAGTDEFDSGAIDDLRIYDTALTAAQIQQIYNSTKLVSLAITPANPKLLVGQQQQFTAVGTYGDGSHQDLTSSVIWTLSSVSVANSAKSGVATAIATGNTTLWATAGSIKASVSLNVSSVTLVSLAVTPANPSIAAGQRQQFTATGTYSDGSHQNITSTSTWTSSTTSVASISSGGSGITFGTPGVAIAVAAGTTVIQATSGSISGSTSLTVTPPTLVSITVTPANPSIAAGQQQQFTATGTYTDASKKDLTSTATWTSSATSFATISGTGLATGVAAGSATIQATSGSINGSTKLTVTAPTLVSITVTPANPSIAAGQQQQFTATGNYTDGSNQNLTSTATWTSSATAIATIAAGGMATGVAQGSTTVQATSGSINGSTKLTVTAPTLVSITVTPANPSIAAGQQQQFTATGNYTDGSHQNLTSTATWTSSVTSVATIAVGGMATSVAAGSTVIQATSGSISGSTTLTVTAPTLVSITVTPANPSIAAGQQQQFTATGNYTDGSHQNLTSTATWTSSATAIATIAAGGMATGVAQGSTTIQATSGSISGSTTLTVTAPTLVSITVTPANPSIAAGQQQQFTATGNYTDGSHQNLTASATWTSSATSVATIAAGGMATGVAAGSTVIQATSGSISGSTSLTVTAPVLVSITVTPANPSIAAGQQQQFTATGNYTDGSRQNLSTTATWTSSVQSVATIAAGGMAAGVAQGSTTIQATSGSISGSTTLTVTAPVLVSITVTPANPSIAAGQQQQFTATGNYTDGSHQNLTASATWTSSATSVATIAAGGMATGVAAGSTVIQATSGSITGSTTLTVTAQISHSVTLSWTASTSSGIAGYNAYRATVSGGPYTLLNSSLIASTTYTDQAVQSGITYYYVTTAVDSQGVESAYSNEAAATVP